MKHVPWRRAGAFLLLGLLAWAQQALALPPLGSSPVTQDLDRDTHFDANSIDMFVTNHGSFAYNIGDGNSGLTFPKGSQNTAVFAAGLWIGAKVGGDTRVTVNEYSWECIPGMLNTDGTWDTGWGNNPRWRTYKINRGDTDETNDDYAEWPAEDGAPLDSLDNPLVLGDQTLWCVYHDGDPEAHSNTAGLSLPLGLEIQQTTFGFNLAGPLENVVFLKFLLVNRGEDTLEDTFISLWSDPDLGGAGDDLVGCDTTLSLGYCYNSTNRDLQYGSRPPAVGMDFFQGPIVPSEGDTAHVSGREIPGFRNLPMTSFNKYINGTDPSSATDSYNYMLGLERNGTEVIDPTTGQVTRFNLAGDPVARTGWLDSNAADRRMMLSSGPFTMEPWVDSNGNGDPEVGEPGVQEVVSAVIVGQARDRLTSITAMKFNDRFAQTAFDLNFDLPNAPPAPQVLVGELDGTITLSWGEVSETEYDEPGYAFEGYNVYQLASPDAAAQRALIATFDVNNGTGIIFDEQFDVESGVVVVKPVQFGTDAGIAHNITIREDFITGGDLRNGKEYYYLVTAYSYNPAGVAGLQTLESSFIPHTVVPQAAPAGTRYQDGSADDVLPAEHVSGGSDGQVIATLVDPAITTGETYEVTFDFLEEEHIEIVDGVPETTIVIVPVWNLATTDGREVLSNQRNLTGDLDYLVADGILWQVIGALPGFKINARGWPMIDEILSGGNPVEPDGQGGPGNDVYRSPNSTGEWRVASSGDGSVARFTRDGADLLNLTSSDILLKWDNDPDNIGWWAFDNGEVGTVPFGLYERDPITGIETRLVAIFFSGGVTPGVYDISADIPDYGGRPATDWLYAYRFTGDYADFVADAGDGSIDNDPTTDELFARLVFASADSTLPSEGTVIQFSTTKPNTVDDKFVIETQGVGFAMSNLKDDLSNIRVVPNPYRNQSIYELNAFARRVKFTNLPQECTIRIFNLAGDLVTTIQKEPGPTSVAEWDLLTSNDLPVASGVYIYHVEAKEGGRVIGSTTGKMAIFMEKERLNTF